MSTLLPSKGHPYPDEIIMGDNRKLDRTEIVLREDLHFFAGKMRGLKDLLEKITPDQEREIEAHISETIKQLAGRLQVMLLNAKDDQTREQILHSMYGGLYHGFTEDGIANPTKDQIRETTVNTDHLFAELLKQALLLSTSKPTEGKHEATTVASVRDNTASATNSALETYLL